MASITHRHIACALSCGLAIAFFRTQVIAIFAKVEYTLPNLIVASLTREAIRDAVGRGIAWSLIVQFLERNAHPLMAAGVPVLPETVVNQLALWAQETRRVQASEAKHYKDFESIELFDRAISFPPLLLPSPIPLLIAHRSLPCCSRYPLPILA